MTPVRLPGGPVRAVLLDYGMTLVTFRRPDAALHQAYEAVAQLLAGRLRRPVPGAAALVEAVHDAVDAAVAEHERSGTLLELALGPVYAAAYRGLGLELCADLLEEVERLEQRAWFSAMVVAPGTVDALAALRRRGLRLGLCSNAPYHPAAMREQLAHVGLDALLDSVTFSSAVGWRKPAPQIFARALADLGASPAETVMVGDRLREDVEGARAAGMRAVLLTAHRAEPDPQGRAQARVGGLEELLELLP